MITKEIIEKFKNARLSLIEFEKELRRSGLEHESMIITEFIFDLNEFKRDLIDEYGMPK